MSNKHTFVTTAWLSENLTNPDIRLIDIRGRVAPATDPLPHYFSHRAAYDIGHLPGAVFVDWITDITIDGPHHMQIASADKFAALMSQLGIGTNTLVVAYDDAGGMFAARLWWALNYYGHEKVAVLDGGWQKWLAEGRPVTAEVPVIQPAQFIPSTNLALRRTADDVASVLNSDIKLVDVRTPEEFMGKASRAKRSGHIPSAVNVPRGVMVNPEGESLPGNVVQKLLLNAGVKAGDEVVFYCNGGVSASYGLLAAQAAGYEGGAVYDGSWKDWGNDESRPIES